MEPAEEGLGQQPAALAAAPTSSSSSSSISSTTPPAVVDLQPSSQSSHLLSIAPGRTLLPGPIASAISLWTRSTGLALRVGTVIGAYGFGVAKTTTLSSLELGRGVIEGILQRAGHDAFLRSDSDLGRSDAETIMESSLESLHLAMSQVVFWTNAGFQLTGLTLSTLSDLSQLVLSYLDSVLGSTESSRAIASIITLIRREFSNPATGQPGEKVGVFDLVVGIVGLAYFQTWAWTLIQQENHRLQVEEILWDVVIVDDQEILGRNRADPLTRPTGSRPLDDHGPNEKAVQTLQRYKTDDGSDAEACVAEIRLRQHILRSLPAGATVAITTETKTTKTITVDVSGTPPHTLAPPAGVELIEETRFRPCSSQGGQQRRSTCPDQLLLASGPPDPTTYRLVFRVNKNELRSTEIVVDSSQHDTLRSVEPMEDSETDGAIDNITTGSDNEAHNALPALPPKSPPQMSRPRIHPDARFKERQEVAERHLVSSPPPAPRPASPSGLRRGSAEQASTIPISKPSHRTCANQKRPRAPIPPPPAPSSTQQTRKKSQSVQSVSRLLSKKAKGHVDIPNLLKSGEKKGGLRNVLKKGAPGPSSSTRPSSVATKEGKLAATAESSVPSFLPSFPSSKGKQPVKDLVGFGPSKLTQKPPPAAAKRPLPLPSRASSRLPTRDGPDAIRGGVAPRYPLTSRALAEYEARATITRTSSRASYLSVRELRHDSLLSQTDTYPLHPAEEDLRPATPTCKVSCATARQRSGIDATTDGQLMPPSPSRNHGRMASQLHSPSIYTLRTTDSQLSLVAFTQRSPFNNAEALSTLRRTGTIDSTFPRFHLLRNISRYMRFSSASYGSNFLKMLGILKTTPPMLMGLDGTNHELRTFAHHTRSAPQSILLSSFVDPQGGSDSSGSTETGVPLVHYISLDDDSKAVVLSCRGTLGFEDVLADMTCDYDDLMWRGRKFKVHKGIHASARRLLYGGDGRVLVTIKAALEENPDYGVVLCGHSLGGAVTALLGIMLSEPVDGGASFVTSDEPHSRLLPYHSSSSSSMPRRCTGPSMLCLPPGRPIHVYAYGPPSTMSPALRQATRGLITSVVHGQDLVPYLSLGVLHDFQAVALAFKTDNEEAKQEIKQRVWEAMQGAVMDKWTKGSTIEKDSRPERDDERWAFAAFKTLRASMMSEKLLPPGEVFVVETEAVLRRDAFVRHRRADSDGDSDGDGREKEQEPISHGYMCRPARRIVLKYVRDVETRFREIRFGATMLTDHNPAKYEDALDGLRFGVA